MNAMRDFHNILSASHFYNEAYKEVYDQLKTWQFGNILQAL